jgi:hypothetical protein
MSTFLLGNTGRCAVVTIAKANEFSGAKDRRAVLSFPICFHATRRTFRQMYRDVLGDGKATACACIALCTAIAKALSGLLMLFAFDK